MPVESVNQFRGLGAIGQIGQAGIPKTVGQQFAANLFFEYQGPGGTFDIGIGFAPAALVGFQNVTDWYPTTVSLPPAATWTASNLVGVVGTIPATMAPGLKDILKWIQTPGGPRDPGGNGFLPGGANWDQDVYEVVMGQSFQNLQAAYA